MAKLEGTKLATKVKALCKDGTTLSAAAIECGYFSETANGNKIPSSAPFKTALLSAAGFEFTAGRRGSDSTTANVMGNGTMLMSPTRVKAANIKPGDKLTITYNEDDGSFILKKKSPESDW